MAGTLYVVATPIGNLEDITLRALRTLREVDLIAAEDTRRTAKLLAHYNIQRPVVSLHEHNERRQAPILVDRIAKGSSVALVSDAGTPGIADPGQYLVQLAHQHGITVSPIPGPSAVMAALSASGLEASEFVFLGFAPRGGAKRTAWFTQLQAETRTTVFFEVPHRIAETMDGLQELVKKHIMVFREITKIHEQLAILPNTPHVSRLGLLGEFVVVVGPASQRDDEPDEAGARTALAVRMIGCMTISGDFVLDAAIDLASRAVDVDAKAIRKALKKRRIAENRERERLS